MCGTAPGWYQPPGYIEGGMLPEEDYHSCQIILHSESKDAHPVIVLQHKIMQWQSTIHNGMINML